LVSWLDALPYERIVLGGFSMGCVMSLAASLGAELARRPVAVCGFSGFVPVVDGWAIDTSRPLPPAALGHGTMDPVITVDFGRRARDEIVAAGGEVFYREYPLPHTLDPRFLVEVRDWLWAGPLRGA
ncbi:MAG: alpha/beta hydrolase, partial [Gaiellaceae bacterium]